MCAGGKRCGRREEPNLSLNSDVGYTRSEGYRLGFAMPIKVKGSGLMCWTRGVLMCSSCNFCGINNSTMANFKLPT